ncbi:AT-rich interactive domain-containing protein 2-like isoform X2 [Abrus precatorius]|nr:AT-rich interactive domain-containing protein 2-like isoform X2 [Abrus precatorius]
MLGDEQRVDLYKLFLVVKGKGGYDAVCNGKLWDLVGEESGLGLSVGSSVKLVYGKYLSALDVWLKKVTDSKVPPECGLVYDRDKFGRQLMELQTEVKGLSGCAKDEVVGEELKGGFDDDFMDGRKFCSVNEVKGFDLESDGDEEIRNGGCPDLDMPDCGMDESVLGNSGDGNDAVEVQGGIDGGKMNADAEQVGNVSDAANNGLLRLLSGSEKCDDDGDGCLVLDTSGGDREGSVGKRKRESILDMLSWVTGVAMNPCDPEVGSIPEKSKWKSYSNKEVWKQALLYREAVFLKKGFESSSEQQNWQSQKMHPCMYDDHLGATYNLRERLKSDRGVIVRKHTSVRSSSDSSEGILDRTPSPHTEDRAEKRLLDFSDGHSGLDRCATVRIPVGSNHQAEIPEWTGMTSEGDSKWLGTRVWPSKTVNSRLLIERDPIGKGRQDSCGCSVPGSVECVRFHIGEKRAKVKLELGEAFHEWNFDKVGEDVKKLWTEEEEKKFENVVRSNRASSETYFWDHIFRTFPEKSRADLVSYYFNVFLLQRRGHQNRHTPANIDSDDDESEFGPLRNVFGHQTQNSRGSIMLTPKKPQTKGG